MNSQIQCRLETITPERAAMVLNTSNGNRTIRREKVDAYARDMLSGKWMVNGETIIIDEFGALLDGHHRLAACVRANSPMRTMLVTGAPRAANTTIDMGTSRSIADALSFSGFKNTRATAAIVVAYMSLQRGVPVSATPSSTEVLDFVEAHPLIVEAENATHQKVRLRADALIGAMYLAEAEAGNVQDISDFIEVLRFGVPHYKGCAAHALREKLLKDAGAKTQLKRRDVHRLVTQAFEKFCFRMPVQFLRLQDTFNVRSIKPKEPK